MKLCQFQAAGGGRRVGVLDGDAVIDITAPKAGAGSVLDLLLTGRTPAGIERLARRLSRAPRRPRHAWAALDRAARGKSAGLLAPMDPPEVWGAGITYRRSREYYSEHDTGQAHRGKGIYDYVYEAERPELFYKGSAARSVGPHGTVGLRGDSKLTAVEAELAVVVGRGGRHRRLHGGQRSLGLGHRAREPPLPAPVEDLPGQLRLRPRDRDAGLDPRCRTRSRSGA